MGTFQEHRLIRFTSPLGEDVLLLQRLRGTERLSRLFHFELELLSARSDIRFEDIVGKSVTLSIELDGGGLRHWSGCISAFRRGSLHEGMVRYQAEMVPWPWFLTRHRDSRVFQHRGAPDILRELFDDFNFRDHEFRLQDEYPEIEYCTQYQERTADFMARLLEREGLYYYIDHRSRDHRLVVADHARAHDPARDDAVRYHGLDIIEQRDSISEFDQLQDIQTGRIRFNDYNFESPRDNLEVVIDTNRSIGDNSNYEYYEHPGGYDATAAGERYARLAMEAEEARQESFSGKGNVREFSPGYVFDLTGHPLDEYNRKYLLVAVWHEGENNYGDGGGQGSNYRNRFECIRADVPYRAERRSPKPMARGVQTAVVVGPAGEDIHTDRYGRIKVQFHWDRRGRRNENSSCWVRVAQPWAGPRWGFMAIPRIGQEVLVDFIDGDVDRPVVVGSLYNGDNMPPWELPGQRTRSGIVTRSSPHGDGGCANELRFEDRQGAEEVLLHAERDLRVEVEHDEQRSVDNDRKTTVQHDDTLTVMNQQDTTVMRDRTALVGGNDKLTVTQQQEVTVAATRSVTVGASDSLNVGGTLGMTVGGALTVSAGGVVSVSAGGAVTITAAVITLNAPAVVVSGTLIASTGVVSPMYTPGVGNLL